LDEHHDYGKWDATEALLDRPTVDQHANRNHDAHKRQRASQTVFWDANTALRDVLLRYEIRVTPTKERPKDIPASRRQIEETTLDGAGEVEARVEGVPDGREERVHVPEQ